VRRSDIAYVASYYGISPLEVSNWKTREVDEWMNGALDIEKMKAKAMKEARDGQKS
jgi:uncharacterized protein YjcR